MLGERLSILRQSKGLSQTQLAERIGVQKQSVSNWENNNIMPSVDMLEKLADFFSVSTDYLLSRESPNQSGVQVLDVTGLRPEEIAHVQLLIDDLRNRRF